MLVLSRKPNESIRIGENITVEIAKVRGDKVSIRISAPPEVRIWRTEIDPARVPAKS